MKISQDTNISICYTCVVDQPTKGFAMRKRDIYPIELIHSSLGDGSVPSKSVLYSEQMRSLMIYCLMDMGDGNYLPLNRDYKPLGLERGEYADYKDYKFLFIPKDRINFKLLWDNGVSFGSNSHYFYSDYTYPSDKKTFLRYMTIVSSAFFGEHHHDHLLMFNKLWSYRNRNNDEDYINNLNKFKEEKSP